MLVDKSEIKKKKLLILGNGFDLHCNLKSKFSDFMFEEVFIKGDTRYLALEKHFLKKNIWYYLLAFRFYYKASSPIFLYVGGNDIKWMDVEDFIKCVLVKDKNNRLLPWLKETFEGLKSFNFYTDHISDFYGDDYFKAAVVDCIDNIKDNYSDIFQLLFGELNQFEKDFSDYLKRQLDKCDYLAFAHKTLDAFKENKLYDKLYIWSFNYTDPSHDYDNCRFQRIHGGLYNDVSDAIIGIDQNDINDIDENLNIIRFTKAWRKISTIGFVEELPNKEEVDEICIYGHSLGKQDYSYFHSIFNYYGFASDSKIVVRFYYSDYALNPDGTPNTVENDKNYNSFIDSVFKLLIDYASNSINEKESKTLITRLLLERRVLIEKLND